MKKNKLLYVTPSFQSFVKSDLRILQNHFDLKINHYKWQNKSMAPLYFFLQFFSTLKTIWNSKLIVVNFGGYWAYWPVIFAKLFRKKSVVIVHGTDCAAIPEINYGSLRIPLLRKICGWAYSKTDMILPVSESLIQTELTFDPQIKNKKQGIKSLYPHLAPNFNVIYNGLDENFWTFSQPKSRKKNSFLAVMSSSQFSLKGGDLILDLAKVFPHCQFYFAGLDHTAERGKISGNVHFLGKLSPELLRERYQLSEFYFQLSSFEGFGCSLAEAMLCGCIPIGSSSNHIPSIIGNAGFVLQKKDLNFAQNLLNEVLESNLRSELSSLAREQIVKNYSLEIRENRLISVLNELL